MIRSALCFVLAALVLLPAGCGEGSSGGGLKPTVKEAGMKDGPPKKKTPAGPPGGSVTPTPE